MVEQVEVACDDSLDACCAGERDEVVVVGIAQDRLRNGWISEAYARPRDALVDGALGGVRPVERIAQLAGQLRTWLKVAGVLGLRLSLTRDRGWR